MGNGEEAALWVIRKFAKKFVENLEEYDRITVDKPGDPETTYTLQKPSDAPSLIFKDGDREVVKEAISLGLLEPTADATYQKKTLPKKERETKRSPIMRDRMKKTS